MSEKIGLRWTGHPVIDMGVAAVVINTENDTPDEVTVAQWKSLLNTLQDDYIKGKFVKHSDLLFMRNSFDNNSFRSDPQKRTDKIKEVFSIATKRENLLSEECSFFPEFSAVMRASRERLPLIQGNDQINFFSDGVHGIPISSLALSTVLAIPLVTLIASGRLMIVAIDDKNLLLDLCEEWYKKLKGEFAKISLNGGALRERKAPRTRLIDSLQELFPKYKEGASDSYTGITLYALTNTGQGPRIDIHSFLPNVYRFTSRANAAKYRPLWMSLTNAFWISDKGKKTDGTPTEDQRPLFKNLVFESLPSLPVSAPNFIRRFFLEYVKNRVGLSDKNQVTDMSLWILLDLFLNEIITMKKERIAKIRDLADELANEIYENNDKGLFRQLMGLVTNSTSYIAFRQILLRTLRERLRRKGKLLLTLDDYLLLFETGEEYPEANWHLVRDLVRIRCLETLHDRGYFTEAPELLDEETEEVTTS